MSAATDWKRGGEERRRRRREERSDRANRERERG